MYIYTHTVHVHIDTVYIHLSPTVSISVLHPVYLQYMTCTCGQLFYSFVLLFSFLSFMMKHWSTFTPSSVPLIL